ncbi:MAG: glycoside hydrolase family 32 protein [Clostridiales bacterium]|jgi:sucrose-6-phosphate hydrolase SacC (GH32 family)|nr:glycoside hydrolase family 32 protein [Clostridiales bacterium]
MNTSREILIENRYINFPVKDGALKRLLRCSVDDEPFREFEIELASEEPDYWVFMDVSKLLGRRLNITACDTDDEHILDVVEKRDVIKGAENLYREKYRPQFHFSTRRGWINDPNGLVYYKGEYHLFYQHNPYGCKWGNMHWGHAVSRDLVHWDELEDALYPDEMGTMFSGSGVVDTNNTSGFKCGEEDPIVLFYTAAGGTSVQSKGRPFTQCIAYSTDRGRTWIKYKGNPVLGEIKSGNRDPKVVWHENTRHWIMALYLEDRDYALFASPDLKNWSQIMEYRIEGTGECPDLFELPVDGNTRNKKWVFWSANGSYLIGNFDGSNFYEEYRHVTDSSITGYSYAAQTWSNIPKDDGRVIQISWATIDIPGMPFNGCMTFPCELTLRTTDEGVRLFRYPVKEIEKLYRHSHSGEYRALKNGTPVTVDVNDELLDICCDFDLGTAERIMVDIHGVKLRYDVREQKLHCMDKCAVLKPQQQKLGLRILVDRAIIEIFGNEGLIYMSIGVLDRDMNRSLQFLAEGGEAMLNSFNISALNSIWT